MYIIPFSTMGLMLYCWRGGKIDNYWYFRSLIEFSLILFAIYVALIRITALKRFAPHMFHFVFNNNLGLKPLC